MSVEPLVDFLAAREHRTVGHAIREGAKRYTDRPYLSTTDGEHYSFGEIHELSNRVGHVLLARGLRQGDHVALMLPNGAEFVGAWLALVKIGIVTIPIEFGCRGELLRYLLEHSDARALVTDSASASVQQDSMPDGLEVVRLDDGWRMGGQALASLADVEELPMPSTEWTSLVAIAYTGGTTGRSKGVMISHNYALAEGGLGRPIAQQRMDAQDVLFCCLSLHHGILWPVTLQPWLVGARLVVAPRFSASRFWSQVREHRATVTMLVGAMVPYLYKRDPEPADADNPLREIWGNPMPREIHRAFERRFGVVLLDSYAMTEASVMTASEAGRARPGSCGTAVEDAFDVAVVDEHDEPCAAGQVGQFAVRPKKPHIMMEGYYKDPAATLAAMRNLWFHTGDLGYRDEDGYFFFVGRSKDAIRRSGEIVSAQEIEGILRHALPQVRDVAVTGVPAEFGDEEIRAVFELRPGAGLTPDEVKAVIEAELPKSMRPRFVAILPEFPRTALGRVQKGGLPAHDRSDIDLISADDG